MHASLNVGYQGKSGPGKIHKVILVNPLHPQTGIHSKVMDSPHCSLYIPCGTDKGNMFDNLEHLKWVIVFFILMAFTFDARVMV